MLGVLIVTQPWNAMSNFEVGGFSKYQIIIGTVVTLTGAASGGVSLVSMRIMKDIHYSISPFWFATGCAFYSPMFCIYSMSGLSNPVIYSWELIGLITATTLFSLGGQVFYSKAYQLEKAARVAALSYLNIVIGFMWDVLYFKTQLQWHHVIGSIIISGTLACIVIFKSLGILK